MATKFGVYNPNDGTIDRVETVEEAKQLFVERVVGFVSNLWQGVPYVQIEEHDNGTETWKNVEGAEIAPILSAEQLVAALQAQAAAEQQP